MAGDAEWYRAEPSAAKLADVDSASVPKSKLDRRSRHGSVALTVQDVVANVAPRQSTGRATAIEHNWITSAFECVSKSRLNNCPGEAG